MTQPLTLALLQTDLEWENPAANRRQMSVWLQQLTKPAHVVILPEMWTTGFSMRPERVAEPAEGPATNWMLHTAQQHQALVMGSVATQWQGGYVNRLWAAYPDGQLRYYDKRYLFTPGGEKKAYQPGNQQVVFSWQGWRLCPQICYDLRFPECARNDLSQPDSGYDLLVYVANWPRARISQWENLLVARAIENQAYVAGVNRLGVDGAGLSYTGHSLVADYTGLRMTRPNQRPGWITATLDAEALQNYRQKLPFWQDRT